MIEILTGGANGGGGGKYLPSNVTTAVSLTPQFVPRITRIEIIIKTDWFIIFSDESSGNLHLMSLRT